VLVRPTPGRLQPAVTYNSPVGFFALFSYKKSPVQDLYLHPSVFPRIPDQTKVGRSIRGLVGWFYHTRVSNLNRLSRIYGRKTRHSVEVFQTWKVFRLFVFDAFKVVKSLNGMGVLT
jgi:hypothetical protein